VKFQCGICDKIYKIENLNALKSNLTFRCETCHNKFFIKKGATFSSSSKNSKVVCEVCDNFIHEEKRFCEFCTPTNNKTHDDLRIDNKFYALYDVNDNGKTYNRNTGKRVGSNKVLLPVCGLIFLVICLSSIYFFSKKTKTSNSSISNTKGKFSPEKEKRREAQIVITKTGRTYYAKNIETDGNHLQLSNDNGEITKIRKEDVLQISKAVIEK
jgi:hypothetical protein